MTVAVYYASALTLDQYKEIDRKLRQVTGDKLPDDLIHHSCFGDESNVEVFEIWASREAFDRDSERILLPIFEDLGIEFEPPTIAEVHALMQSAESQLVSAE